jgi:chemotaxis protein CheD
MIEEAGPGIDIFLNPGEWYFGDRHTRIRTTLGSCVAVTLWHPDLKVGGMCHYMLPEAPVKSSSLNPRYGQDALKLLANEMDLYGGGVDAYEAKLFGGASMFGPGPIGNSVADRNIEAALTLAAQYGLRVVAQSLGGTCYRQLVFGVVDGNVWVRLGGNDYDSGSPGVDQ